ncbi:MAG: geranylgeranylglyceryl/heptaprenylglyceryl phosphate synthase [Methanosarcinales archaeon]
MNVRNLIEQKLDQNKLIHITLLDIEKITEADLEPILEKIFQQNTDVVVLAGVQTDQKYDKTARLAKEMGSLPVFSFLTDYFSITPNVDRILVGYLLNSSDSYYALDLQIKCAPLIKLSGVETIPVGYMILEPNGSTLCGWIPRAHPVPSKDVELAIKYASVAKLRTASFIILDAGKENLVDVEMVRVLSKVVNVPIAIGGRKISKNNIKEYISAGAKIIISYVSSDMDLENISEIQQYL